MATTKEIVTEGKMVSEEELDRIFLLTLRQSLLFLGQLALKTTWELLWSALISNVCIIQNCVFCLSLWSFSTKAKYKQFGFIFFYKNLFYPKF